MSKEFGAIVIASSFIKQYYEMMTKTPENLHKFYNEESNFMHSDSNETKNASGPEAIRAAIAALNLKNTKVDLSNGFVDAQKCANNGVLVSVMGVATASDNSSKPFSQSFLLSCQGSTSYYVSNSIFRQLVSADNHDLVNLGTHTAKSVHHPAPAAPVVHAPAPVAAAPVPVVHAPAPVVLAAPAVAAAAVVAAAVVEATAPVPAPIAEESDAEEEEAVPAAPAAPAAPVDPSKKLNYSDIVRKQAAAAAAAPAATGALPVKRVVKAEKPAATAAAPAAASSSSAAKESKNGDSPVPVHAAYVRSLPEQTTAQELRDLFSQFGTIHQVDHVAARVYAFVKFTEAAGLQAALAHAAPLQLHGKTISVEERSSNKAGGADKKGGDSKGPRKDGERRADKKADGKPASAGERKGDGEKRGNGGKPAGAKPATKAQYF